MDLRQLCPLFQDHLLLGNYNGIMWNVVALKKISGILWHFKHHRLIKINWVAKIQNFSGQ